MERCGVTEDDIADRSGLGVNTISNMRRGKKVKLETVLAFCVALELEEAFRDDLMKKANVDFDMTLKTHRFYKTILDLCPEYAVDALGRCKEEGCFNPAEFLDIKQKNIQDCIYCELIDEIDREI